MSIKSVIERQQKEDQYINLCDYYLEEVRYYINSNGKYVIDSYGDHARRLFNQIKKEDKNYLLRNILKNIVKDENIKLMILTKCPGNRKCPYCNIREKCNGWEYFCPACCNIDIWVKENDGFPEGCALDNVEFY